MRRLSHFFLPLAVPPLRSLALKAGWRLQAAAWLLGLGLLPLHAAEPVPAAPASVTPVPALAATAAPVSPHSLAPAALLRQAKGVVQDSLHVGADWLVGAKSEPLVLEQGTASYLANMLHGRKTASGERYDMNELTAAHKTLPFGTRVIVRSLQTGREVAVRIVDRGPHLKNRIIDLSHAAAAALGIKGHGISEVQIVQQTSAKPAPGEPARASGLQ
ncbi:septal ring lytic transglycosylase RlpA family protein [Malikia spinosa]|uniref:septal ring lytic transglycosylase RlpA family protein n=1 Tax=Malikia spinosa TaxID=86180 RepID=UPI003FA1FD36